MYNKIKYNLKKYLNAKVLVIFYNSKLLSFNGKFDFNDLKGHQTNIIRYELFYI